MNKINIILLAVFVFAVGVVAASNIVDLQDWVKVEIVSPLNDGMLAVVNIDYEHFETHEGDHYFIKTYDLNTGGASSATYFGFTTPETNDTRIHARVWLAPDADTLITIYEGADIEGGVPVPGINNDRDSANVALLVPVAAPTVNELGDAIWVSRNGGGREPVGVTPGNNYEIIAKTNTSYVFELEKQTTADTIVNIDFWWYEDGGPPYE